MNKTLRLIIPFVLACLSVGILIYLAGIYSQAYAFDPQEANQVESKTTEIVVTTLEDELNSDGDCSLREALQAAGSNIEVDHCPAGDAMLTDTIVFDMAGTIIVDSQLVVNGGGPLEINGNNAITTSGGYTTNIWWVEQGRVILKGIAIVNGGDGGLTNDGTLTILDSTVSGNQKECGFGGGILNYGTLTISNTTVSNNFNMGENCWDALGGGIDNEGTLTVVNSTFSGNFAHTVPYEDGEGGAIYNYGPLSVINSTFTDNSADFRGGGIETYYPLTIVNSTFEGNASYEGGGIWIYNNPLTLINTIVAHSGSGGDCATLYGSFIDGGHNIDTDGTCNLDPANGSFPNTEPQLGPLQDNGGPTFTHALLEGSPAIDAGEDAQCPLTDQRGFARPVDGDRDGVAVCDIGPYEYDALPIWEINLFPPNQHEDGVPGDILAYTIELQNDTDIIDTYSLELGSHLWDWSLSSDVIGPVSPDSSQTFALTVTIPADAAWHQTDGVVITATSLTNPAEYTAFAHITAHVYAPPQISVAPEALQSDQMVGQVLTQSLTISNGNGIPLDFNIQEGQIAGDQILLLHLDEPAGSISFNDSSINGHDGVCSPPGCPTAGIPGIAGTSLTFDGINDEVDLGPWFDLQSFTLALWVKDNGSQVECANIIDNFNWGDWSWTVQKCWLGNPTEYYYFHAANPDSLIQFSLEQGEWQFLVVTLDETSRVSKVYVDGNLVGTATGSDQIHYYGTQFLHLANWGGGGRFWNGSMDEVIIFNRALTDQEVKQLYQLGGSSDTSWLSADPISGTVEANSAIPIKVTFDSTSTQPDTYRMGLFVENNDPLNPVVPVPVTMTVEPTPSMGWVEGSITDQRTGMPLLASIIAEGQPYTVTSDIETGYYRLWLEEGTYTLQVSAPGYASQIGQVLITAQQGITQDFALLLDAPWLVYSPEAFDIAQEIGLVTTHTLTLSNTGTMPLEFSIGEILVGSVLALKLDELAGATSFDDFSPMGNDGSCSGDSCPQSGVDGYDGYAVSFDGDNDYIQASTHGFPYGNDNRTLALWVKMDAIVAQEAFFAGYGNFGEVGQAYILGASIQTTFFSAWGCPVFGPNIDIGQWYHVAVTTIGNNVTLYLNGEAVKNSTCTIDTPDDTQFYLGRIPGPLGDIRRLKGEIDQVDLFDRALTAEEIFDLYQGTLINLPSWISIVPISGTVDSNDSLPISVTLDATCVQPDVYTSRLFVENNDPLNPIVSIPVTMTVEPTPSMGWVEGTITDLRTGKPLEATIIPDGQPCNYCSDPETGSYKFWLEAGNYALQVSASGYVTQTQEVEILAQQGITQDFALLLDAPWLEIDPAKFEIEINIDQIITKTLTLSNLGTTDLEYDFSIGSHNFEDLVAYYPFDGNADDYSGNNNDGIVINAELTSGVCEIPDTAYEFDGLSAYIKVPRSPDLDLTGSLSLSTWIYIYDFPSWLSGIIDKDRDFTGYNMHIGTSSQLHVRVDNSYIEGGQISTNNWHYIVGTYDGNWIRGYIDGEEIGVATEELPTGIALKDLYIGSWEGERLFSGKIDDVRIYKRALSEAEITLLMNQMYASCTPNPWIVIDPVSGTVPINNSLPIQITFDATELWPNIYSANLYLESNDPVQPVLAIPVTMTVTAIAPESVALSGAESGLAGYPYNFSAAVEPISTSLPLTYTWQAEGQLPVIHTGGLTDTVSFTWDMPGTFAITITAENAAGAVSDSHGITIADVPIGGLRASNDSPTMLGASTTLSATIVSGTNPIFTWDFGDGLTGIGAVITHTYSESGLYTATVTATNAYNSQVDTTLVTVVSPGYQIYLPLITNSSQSPRGFVPAYFQPGSAALAGLVIFGVAGKLRKRL